MKKKVTGQWRCLCCICSQKEEKKMIKNSNYDRFWDFLVSANAKYLLSSANKYRGSDNAVTDIERKQIAKPFLSSQVSLQNDRIWSIVWSRPHTFDRFQCFRDKRADIWQAETFTLNIKGKKIWSVFFFGMSLLRYLRNEDRFKCHGI